MEKGTIYEALLRAKQSMLMPKKNAKNPHFGSKYADLSAILEAAIPALHEAGIVVEETVSTTPDRLDDNSRGREVLRLDFVLASEPTQRISSCWPLRPEKQTPQGYGSALTYGRRYLLQTMCGLAAEDDDGNAASERPKGKKTEPQPQPPPQAQPEPPPPRAPDPPSDSRKKVNTNLWTIFWEKAQAADLDGDAIWAAVKAVRPDLLKHTPKSKGVAQGIINNLTDEDFRKLFAGLEAFQTPPTSKPTKVYPPNFEPDPEEQARAEAEAEAADERAALQEHDPDTGEVYP